MQSFKLIDKKHNPSLGFNAERYELDEYGSEHIHLKNDSKEIVFMVMFRTIPESSSGVAHILEHTTLCGSENYKVRDPFFMMLRRSMSTFMNAFTASDWTAYPFATQNKKDFFNLLDVYLDAVYFPILAEEDFKQEGHRIEFSKYDKSNSPLEYKGVVFNEMKGSMSNIQSITWQALTKSLFPDLTYRHNSGGDPETILELTHDYLKGFHKKFYHPSNATYFTWGDIDAKEIQKFINSKIEKKFQKVDPKKLEYVEKQKAFSAPVKSAEPFTPVSKEQSGYQNYAAWVLGESFNIDELLQAHLVSLLLLGNSASPLYKVLESNDIGKSPAQILGLEDSMRHLMFICGIEGSDEKSQDKFIKLIDSTFKDIVKNGFSQDQIDAAFYQLELSRREISSGSLPYGLQVLLSLAPGALYKADPLALSNVDEALKKLKEKIKEKTFLSQLINKYFIDNPHRVNLEMVPDMDLINNRENNFTKTLEKIKSSMSSKEKHQLVNDSKALAERQEALPDKNLLPKLELSDVPNDSNYPKAKKLSTFGYSPVFYEEATNGLTYNNISRSLDLNSTNEIGDLMLLSNLLGKVGIQNFDYLQLQERISKISGGISASTHFYYDNNGEIKGRLSLSSKFLPENSSEISEIMFEILNTSSFEDDKRVKELMFQNFMGLQQSIVENGHRFAMLAASATHNKLAQIHEISGGLSSLFQFAPFISNNDEATKKQIQQITNLKEKLQNNANELAFVSNVKLSKEQLSKLKELSFKKEGDSNIAFDFKKEFSRIAMPINTQVNFSAMSLDAPLYDPKDSAKYLVLSSILRNEFLHRKVREQGGAYGGGAIYDPFAGSFKLFSYRDPRFLETFEDFEESFKWAAQGDFDDEIMLEGKLSVLSDHDKPSSPAGEAFKDYRFNIEGKNQKIRTLYRKQIIDVSKDEVVEAANSLKGQSKSLFSIINPNLEKKASEEGFLIKRI